MLLGEFGGDVELLYIEMPKLSPDMEAIGGRCWIKLVGSTDVFLGCCVDADHVALANEEWDLESQAGVSRGGFGCSALSVSFKPNLGLCDRQVDSGRRLDQDGFLFVHQEDQFTAFRYEIDGISEHIFADEMLIVGFHVHKDVKIAFSVEILCVATFGLCDSEFVIAR